MLAKMLCWDLENMRLKRSRGIIIMIIVIILIITIIIIIIIKILKRENQTEPQIGHSY